MHLPVFPLCRYIDYREPPWAPDKYEFSKIFWHVVAAQFIFIFVFEVGHSLVVVPSVTLD